MQNFLKIFLVSICLLFATIQATGASIKIQNALSRAQYYSQIQKKQQVDLKNSAGICIKDLKYSITLTFSPHLLGMTSNTEIALKHQTEPSENLISTVKTLITEQFKDSIFKPPRASSLA